MERVKRGVKEKEKNKKVMDKDEGLSGSRKKKIRKEKDEVES